MLPVRQHLQPTLDSGLYEIDSDAHKAKAAQMPGDPPETWFDHFRYFPQNLKSISFLLTEKRDYVTRGIVNAILHIGEGNGYGFQTSDLQGRV